MFFTQSYDVFYCCRISNIYFAKSMYKGNFISKAFLIQFQLKEAVESSIVNCINPRLLNLELIYHIRTYYNFSLYVGGMYVHRCICLVNASLPHTLSTHKRQYPLCMQVRRPSNGYFSPFSSCSFNSSALPTIIFGHCAIGQPFNRLPIQAFFIPQYCVYVGVLLISRELIA